MLERWKGPFPAFAPDDAAGVTPPAPPAEPQTTTDAAGAGGGSDAAAGAGDGAPPSPAPAPVPYRPEGLDEALVGANDKETIDRLAAKVGAIGAPPAKADDYTLALDAALAEKIGDLEADPVLPLWRETAHELGLTQEVFEKAFAGLMGRLIDKGLIEPKVDLDAELAKLAPQERDPGRRKALGQQRLDGVAAELTALIQRETVPAAIGKTMSDLLDTAEGVQALEFVLGWRGEKGIVPGGAKPAPAEDPLKKFYPSMFKD